MDLREGKITLPLIFTLKNCDPAEKALIQETVMAQPITEKGFLRVLEVIERYRGVRYTREKAKEHIEVAKRHLSLFPDSREKEALCNLADFVLERQL